MKFYLKACLALAFLVSAAFFTQSYAKPYTNDTVCGIDPAWVNSPSMPSEVAKSNPDGSSNFCDFYQFSWQAYLYLMSPVAKNSDIRQFQVDANYPLVEFKADGSPANSCDNIVDNQTFRSSLDKHHFTTEQAGGGGTIYDQQKQIVHYDMRFNRAMCNLSGSAVEQAKQGISNFPAGTTELKFGWKTLTKDEIASGSFLTQTPTSGELKGKTLGLIGMHIAIATKDHPEFVWASFEHDNNAPNCSETTDKAWSFTSQTCAKTLPGGFKSLTSACPFNETMDKNKNPIIPSEICRQYPNGTAAGDPNADENNADIDTTNQQVKALLAKAGPGMQKLKDYFILGALWVSDTTQNSDIGNQRGSLRLANPIAETTYQNVDLNAKFISNCFGCHNYMGTSAKANNNITSGNLSHIFFDIQTGQGKAVDIQAGPISSNAQAPAACNKTCGGYNLTWNGNWTTTVWDEMSVCGCQP
ncbi:mannan-binding lectin [Terasakiella sp. A23]|uniref:mannan-binding lectin n=1 Tax=Terasakiella sp. FCG-A23 TaxID=3080561 RepID=UPI002953C43D|nr:mannan-binding lectin [Terasakiella sp. A23]MDV7338937.1 mannan-binding lectin [Terasakiella sp. A23]